MNTDTGLYKHLGFNTRDEYLTALANHVEDELDSASVYAVADLLGPTEDFDGLLSMIADQIGYMITPEDFSEV